MTPARRQFEIIIERRDLDKLAYRGIDTVEKLNLWIAATLDAAIRNGTTPA